MDRAFRVGDKVRLSKNKPLPWVSVTDAAVEEAWDKAFVFTVRGIVEGSEYGIRLSDESERPGFIGNFAADELELVEVIVQPVQREPAPRPEEIRIQELIEANNALVERERAAKREAEKFKAMADTLALEVADCNVMVFSLKEVVSKLRNQIGEQMVQIMDLQGKARASNDTIVGLKATLEMWNRHVQDLKAAAKAEKTGKAHWLPVHPHDVRYSDGPTVAQVYLQATDEWVPARLWAERL